MTYERPTIADFGPANALRSPMRSAYERLRTPYDPPYDHTPHTPHGLRAPFGGAAPMKKGGKVRAVGPRFQLARQAFPRVAHVIYGQVVTERYTETIRPSQSVTYALTGNDERT